MKLLVDTQAWLWEFLGDPSLSDVARNYIADPNNELYLSPASIWEISIKISLGKYALNAPYAQFMQQALTGYRLLDIRPDHTERVAVLPFHHRDPFDRLIVAQAIVEKFPVVSSDGNLVPYPIQVIW